jgi:hypothetical protein
MAEAQLVKICSWSIMPSIVTENAMGNPAEFFR